MSEKITTARIKKFGQTFELSVDPNKALLYKKGEITNLHEVLMADNIFTDIKKGLRATKETLAKAFQTTEVNVVADIILKSGEIQLGAEHRAAEREQKRKQLIHKIHINAIDSKTGLPHPATRIEAALQETKVQVDDHKTVDEQFDDVIKKLRVILPISIEQKEVTITIPASFTGKAYNIVKSGATTKGEEWLADGSWKVKIEMPAGAYQDLVDKLNSVTSGEVVIEEK